MNSNLKKLEQLTTIEPANIGELKDNSNLRKMEQLATIKMSENGTGEVKENSNLKKTEQRVTLEKRLYLYRRKTREDDRVHCGDLR